MEPANPLQLKKVVFRFLFFAASLNSGPPGVSDVGNAVISTLLLDLRLKVEPVCSNWSQIRLQVKY